MLFHYSTNCFYVLAYLLICKSQEIPPLLELSFHQKVVFPFLFFPRILQIYHIVNIRINWSVSLVVFYVNVSLNLTNL